MNWAGGAENFLFFLTYLPYGPLVWLGYGYLSAAGRTKMLLLDKPRPAPNPPPKVSLIVPAKDEEGRIRLCLQSALNQDYPNLEVIAVDDRSVDRTGAIMDEMAAAEPRLKILHIQPGSLGEGWTGKNNALYQATKIATGGWLLFVDSDVKLEPSAVTRSITVSNYKKYDLFSLLPALESQSPWEGIMIPLCTATAATMYLIALNNNDKWTKISFANGQFLLITRQTYDAIGGHETVKDRFCEDTEIARIVKEKGFRSRVSFGDEFCSVRMYDGLPSVIKGWSRIYYAAKVGKKKHILLAIQFLVMCVFSAYAALIYGIVRATHPHGNMLDDAWLGAAVAHLLIMTLVVGMIYKWSRNSVWNALLLPVSTPILLYVLLKALKTCFTKKLEWRGTTYSYTMATQTPVATAAEPVASSV